MPQLPPGYTQHPTNPQYAINSSTGAWVPIGALVDNSSPSTSYSGNVAGKTVKQVDMNAAGSFIRNLRNQIKNGSIDPLVAKNQLNSYLLQQFADDALGNFSDMDNYKAYQSAVSGGINALYSGLGTIKNAQGQFGEVDLQGNFRTTSTTVNKSNTAIGGGGSSSTKNVLPLDITANLGPGSQGQDVIKLQQWLKDQGYFPKNQDTTGYYGDITKNAVAQWQKASGINAGADVGYFGPKSKAYLQSYSYKQTETPEDTSFFGSADFKNLPADQQAVAKSIYDAVSSNDEDAAAKLTKALEEAKSYADPYFKAQVTIALDTLTRGFKSEAEDAAYKERSLSQKLADLREMTTIAKDFLSLDQAADLKRLEQEYQSQLENTQNDLAAAGFGDSTRRSKTENLLSTTKGDMVESTNRAFAKQNKNLDLGLSQGTRDTSQEIERLRQITQDNKTALGRKVEGFVGSKNLPGMAGYSPLGGITGSAEQDYYQDIINATKKFVF